MEGPPLLSILIPTKNREEFTVKVIHHILEINDPRLQLVIQDNSDTNNLEYLLTDCLEDSRMKYYYHAKVLSFVDNFSLGISKCDGDYVTIIGDDDGINPFIIDIAAWAHKNGIEAITPSLPLVYFWPESGVHSKNDCGRLNIAEISCKVSFYDPAKEVVKLLKNGCQNYLTFNLAKAYHGMIKRSVLEEIKNRTGHFIGGLSPDIYLSIAASLLVEKVLIIDYPLTISGICKKSGSSDSATGKHTGALEQAPHFRGHSNYEWSDLVPPFYCVETIWADSALATVKDLKIKNLIKYFNPYVLAANCLKLHPQFRTVILDNLSKNHKILQRSVSKKFYLFAGFLTGPLKTRINAISNQLLHKKSTETFSDIPDIQKASEKIQANIGKYEEVIMNNLQAINQ